jgi:hypothetical protein
MPYVFRDTKGSNLTPAEVDANFRAISIDAPTATANPMGANVIDTGKQLNTKSVNADTTFTFSGAPTLPNTFFGLVLTNSGGSNRTITIPVSRSTAAQANVTAFTLPANAIVELQWRWDGAVYHLTGEAALVALDISDSTAAGRALLTAADDAAQRTLLSAAARVQTIYRSFYVATVANGDVFAAVMEKVGTVVSVTTDVLGSGTCTLTGRINATPLGGTPNAASGARQLQPHASANAYVVGDMLAFAVSANSTCLGLVVTVGFQEALA